MKKIKHFMMAAVALMVAMSFTACSNDDNNSSNYERYQQEVNAAVNRQKSSNKVILLVAFGSTWQQAYDTFDTILDEYKKEFPGWDVYLSFSSAICINQARAGEHAKDPDTPAEVRNYYDPEHWLTAIGKANYKTIVVQSLQVIPGEEYRRVRDSYVKDFMNSVREKARGADVLNSVEPGEMLVKIVHDEIINLLGEEQAPLNFKDHGITIIMLGLGIWGMALGHVDGLVFIAIFVFYLLRKDGIIVTRHIAIIDRIDRVRDVVGANIEGRLEILVANAVLPLNDNRIGARRGLSQLEFVVIDRIRGRGVVAFCEKGQIAEREGVPVNGRAARGTWNQNVDLTETGRGSGDEIVVKLVEIDSKGRLNLSRKACLK